MPSTYLFGISAVMFGIGVAGGIKYAWKGKARAGTVGKAAKVLFAATALCVGSFGLVTFAVAKYMGVNSIAEFSRKMKAVVPEKSASLRDAVSSSPKKIHSLSTSDSPSSSPSTSAPSPLVSSSTPLPPPVSTSTPSSPPVSSSTS